MSELTMCNYCSLRRIQERAKREGKIVTLAPGGIGTDVFVHTKGEPLKRWPAEGPPDDDDSNQVSSMMTIGTSCEC